MLKKILRPGAIYRGFGVGMWLVGCVCVCVCAFYRVAFYTEVLNIRTEPDVCPEPVFSRTNLPFFSTDPHEVCVLRRVVAANCCETNHEANFVSYAWRGATPSVPSIPAMRLDPRMKHVKSMGKMRYIMSSWANVRFCG